MIDRLGTKGAVGAALMVSSLVAFVGARLNARDDSDIFFDNLDNEVDPGGDVTRLLVVLGLILLVNGLALLALAARRSR
jgi:hypothetical protein